jgi:hypothetical protein
VSRSGGRTRVIDLPRAQRALARLDEIARDHPEAFDPDRLPLTPRELTMALKRIGRPPAEDPTVAIPARLPRSMVRALDTVLEERRRAAPSLTRQDLLREAVASYLAGEKRRSKRQQAD